MTKTTTKLTTAVEKYFSGLDLIRATGGGTGERSSYTPLANLLNAVGATLKPKVFCVSELADQGAGHPDFGLYTAKQVQKGRPRQGQTPERGVVEVKSPAEYMGAPQVQDQVVRYLNRYGLVLSTNFRKFELVGVDHAGGEVVLESFILAGTEEEFWRKLEKPRAFANEIGAGLGEYLCRALSHQAEITEPKDLAWLLASYARDGLARVEAAGDTSSLDAVRSALEESLGVHFEDERGTRFFHSTMVQTLFYGVFSAWVLWARAQKRTDKFAWLEAVRQLRAPVLRELFHRLSEYLETLDLKEVLASTTAALDRVNHDAFFARFHEREAVTYFYEPFLEAFDPELRKELGVWYTPSEVVRYMVARVDKSLKDDLGIAGGLAAENVYVLDPCCGTGAYLAEVLRRIAANLQGQGLGALTGEKIRHAATKRVFGFEIMPAPFVVAHLQVDLALRDLDAALPDDGIERPAIFLTNALTDWENTGDGSQMDAFPQLKKERDHAGRVKQDTPILVILGNPPYNGHPGVGVLEERELTDAYRTTKKVRRPKGRGLNDLYVRFFRMAERRIAKTGQGVVCFISNYSWLDGLSFTGMREHYLETFDAIRIDCLNGDKYKTGKVTQDGEPDPSIFSTEGDPIGIQVGTAIATLVRNIKHVPAKSVGFRHLWGQTKAIDLIETADAEPEVLYDPVEPILPLGLSFKPMAVNEAWFDWPTLSELFPTSYPGVMTSRDGFLIDIDHGRLNERVSDYFDPNLTDDEIGRRYPVVMKAASRFHGPTVRAELLRRGGPNMSGFFRYAYRPFDIRWIYWETGTELIHFPVAAFNQHVFHGNLWLVLQNEARPDLSPPILIENMGDLNQMNSGVYCVPIWLCDSDLGVEFGVDTTGVQHRPNLSNAARSYLSRIGASVEDLFHHILAVLHDPTYFQANADALRAEGPRIPVPGWTHGKAKGVAELLAASAAKGRELARLLDPKKPVPGITKSPLRSWSNATAVPSTVDNRNMDGRDYEITIGWGHRGIGDAVMPGKGHVVDRPYTLKERDALGATIPLLGDSTFDIFLNDNSYWGNVPAEIWNYKLGGYQVLKKWLSYREQKVLGRALNPEEVAYFAEVARRIGGILMLTGRSGE